MRIGATSDIHYRENDDISNLVNDASKQDVFIVAGDISQNEKRYRAFLRKFHNIKIPKLLVFGNHDLYTLNGTSVEKADRLKTICKEEDFYLLDSSPIIIGDIGFFGGIGWYDYSFLQKENTKNSLVVYPMQDKPYLKKVDDLTDEDLMSKEFSIAERHHLWADKSGIKWKFRDKDFLELQIERLRSDIALLKNRTKHNVYISHHIPIQQFVYRKDGDALWGIFNAYQGSNKLGEEAMKIDNLELIICGHSHIKDNCRIGRTRCYNVSQEERPATITSLEIHKWGGHA